VTTLAVKGVAFLKELVVAHRFGTSDEVDAFIVAMLIPSVVALAVGNSLRDAFVPVYAKQRLSEGAVASRLLSNIIWCSVVVLSLFSLAALIFNGPLLDLLARGFSPEKRTRSSVLLCLTIPYIICFSIAGLLKGYLQAHGRFGLPAAAPTLIPASVMLVVLVMPGEANGAWLAIGTSLGSGALLGVLLWSSRRVHQGHVLMRPRLDEPTQSVLRSALPLFAGAVVLEGYFFIDTMMAATLPAGSVAILTYGERICGVFCIAGMAIAQSLFPHVSDLVARESWQQLGRMTLGFATLTVVLSLPVVAAFWFAAEPIVRFVFERGEFTAADTQDVAEVLRFAGFQVPGSILVALSARVVMALRANHFVLISAICGLAANVGLNLLFMRWYGVKGIALSTALVNALSAILLYSFATARLRRLASSKAKADN
jgi:putative peptidoglycan lipid II flippase